MNTDTQYRQQLAEQITKIRQELKERQARLHYNIFAGVTKKSLDTQRKTIFELEIQLFDLEYKYEHQL